jgi:invasion protein IalB
MGVGCDKLLIPAKGAASCRQTAELKDGIMTAAFLTWQVRHVAKVARASTGLRFARRCRDSGPRDGMMGQIGRDGHTQFAGLRAAAQILTLAAAATIALTGFSSGAQAQGTVRSVHNDWQVRCDTPPGAQAEQCALMQSVTAEDRPNIGLTVIILKTADKKTRLMRVIAPPGVLLPSGLGLKIDNAEIGRAGFVRCVPNGCVAEVIMDDNLISKLRTGQTATYIIFQTPEEGIGFPMSLKGFGEGFDKLP